MPTRQTSTSAPTPMASSSSATSPTSRPCPAAVRASPGRWARSPAASSRCPPPYTARYAASSDVNCVYFFRVVSSPCIRHLHFLQAREGIVCVAPYLGDSKIATPPADQVVNTPLAKLAPPSKSQAQLFSLAGDCARPSLSCVCVLCVDLCVMCIVFVCVYLVSVWC